MWVLRFSRLKVWNVQKDRAIVPLEYIVKNKASLPCYFIKYAMSLKHLGLKLSGRVHVHVKNPIHEHNACDANVWKEWSFILFIQREHKTIGYVTTGLPQSWRNKIPWLFPDSALLFTDQFNHTCSASSSPLAVQSSHLHVYCFRIITLTKSR